MSQVLIYTRSKNADALADQTAQILSEQLHQLGLNVELCHSLNIPRLVLNNYKTVHMIVENLPLTVNEVFHMALCKALGKATVLSVLNSEKKMTKNLLDFIRPDAMSVSQTNHLKYYRNISCNKFILSAFPKIETAKKNSAFELHGLMLPLQSKLEEALAYPQDMTIYFDGRNLLKKQGSAQLRRRWNELMSQKNHPEKFHLILSDSKINQLLSEGSIALALADNQLQNTTFVKWLESSLNHNNLIILNDYQATGFSSYWTSGRNCYVVQPEKWIQHLKHLDFSTELQSSNCKTSDLFENSVNELSRLYSKLWHQKTTLLTSRSVKL